MPPSANGPAKAAQQPAEVPESVHCGLKNWMAVVARGRPGWSKDLRPAYRSVEDGCGYALNRQTYSLSSGSRSRETLIARSLRRLRLPDGEALDDGDTAKAKSSTSWGKLGASERTQPMAIAAHRGIIHL